MIRTNQENFTGEASQGGRMENLKTQMIVTIILFASSTLQGQESAINRNQSSGDDAQTYYSQAQELESLSRYEDAEKLMLESLRVRPDWAEAYSALAHIYVQAGKCGEAVQALKRALEINPGSWVAQLNLAKLQSRLGNRLEAQQNFLRAIKLNPANSEAHYELAGCYSEEGKYDLAVEELRQAIELKPDYFAAYNDLGVAYYRQQKFAAALEPLSKAVSIRPDSAIAYGNLGMTHLKLDETPAALKAFNRSLELGAADEPLLLYYKAYAYAKSGDVRAAIACLEQALERDPQFTQARFNLGMLYHRSHQKNRSWQTFLQLKKQDPALAQKLNALINRDRVLVANQP